MLAYKAVITYLANFLSPLLSFEKFAIGVLKLSKHSYVFLNIQSNMVEATSFLISAPLNYKASESFIVNEVDLSIPLATEDEALPDAQ